MARCDQCSTASSRRGDRATAVLRRARQPRSGAERHAAPACARPSCSLNRSSASLEVARLDAVRGELRPARRWDWGRTSGVLLQGPPKDYAVLALWNVDTPSLAGGDVGRRVYESPGRFPVVSAETPVRGRLALCARRAGD